MAVTHYRTSVEATEAHHGALGSFFFFESTKGTDAVLVLPTAAPVQKPTVSLVILIYGIPRPLTSPMLLPPFPTWSQPLPILLPRPGAYGCWRQSWWYSMGWDDKPRFQTDVPYAPETDAGAKIRGRHGPTTARLHRFWLHRARNSRGLFRADLMTNAAPVTPRRAPLGLRDDQDVAVSPFH